MKYGAILRACRDRIGMSQEQLAERLHRSRSAISKLENDQQELDVRTLTQWAEITGAREVVVAFICGIDGLSILQSLIPMIGG
ncbi:XRE family transcriptional regulator [Paenibacillus pinisoli]|uniref:XRE family transcriptional regulator n=1 Tax=Paenibacillus pinisoli TaxID=1276110 RepID=A0A3A6PRP3_9BACL|nr:helix-turn-helix transcriptional regulator [Paenibacillus pinisoli]RJX40909.1 XRE family transcriptional regulator [Paenibacillus pinisoli]